MQRPFAIAEQNAAGFRPERDDVFARIAERYDLLCDVFSLGIHRLWKAHMANRMAEHAGEIVLDVASGTGDIPHRLLRKGKPPKTLWVTDICQPMLAMAERKLGDTDAVHFRRCDAEDLVEFADASVDVFSIAFGMKICDRHRVLEEAFRVLRPGGSFYSLEAARIPWRPVHSAYLTYMDWCMPLIGKLATGGDAGAYGYLLRGVHDFPDQQAFADEISNVGFTGIRYRNLTFGIVALHEARKPDRREAPTQ